MMPTKDDGISSAVSRFILHSPLKAKTAKTDGGNKSPSLNSMVLLQFAFNQFGGMV